MSQDKGDFITHTGGCHCGKVLFEVDAPANIEVIDCNCSICAKLAFLHLIVPKSQFRLLQGSDVLTTYRFNTGVGEHPFCSVCGIKSFYIPRSHPTGCSVNVRCLVEGTVKSMSISQFNGARWEENIGSLAPLPPEETGG